MSYGPEDLLCGENLMRRAIITAAFLIAANAAGAVEDADRAAGRDVIARQIEAFRGDDAEAAFGFAAPAIRQMFGSGAAFLEMVRRAYPPVHRPNSYAFGEARDSSDGFEQAVAIQDQTGGEWDAVYTFERQPDGSWKISACRLVKRPSEAV